MLLQLTDLFFEKIEDCISQQAYAKTRYIYMFLQPSLIASDEQIARFEAFKQGIEQRDVKDRKEGNDRLIKWLKESIQALKEKRDARALSLAWEQGKPSL